MGEAGGPLRGGVWRQQGSRPGIPARGRAGGDGVRDVGRHGLDALSRDRSARRRTLLPSGAGPVSATRNRGERGSRGGMRADRKSTRLNSSHEWISYAVFCLKKKNAKATQTQREPSGSARRQSARR